MNFVMIVLMKYTVRLLLRKVKNGIWVTSFLTESIMVALGMGTSCNESNMVLVGYLGR